jgi:hypothetical protein
MKKFFVANQIIGWFLGYLTLLHQLQSFWRHWYEKVVMLGGPQRMAEWKVVTYVSM